MFDVPTSDASLAATPQLLSQEADGHLAPELPYLSGDYFDVSFLEPANTDVAFLFSQSPQARDTPAEVQKARVPPPPGEPMDFGLTPLEINKRKLACRPGSNEKVSVENIDSLDLF